MSAASRREHAAPMSHPTSQPQATDAHRRQRDLVLASLLARPASAPTHRRWA
jgi:hypothetical protein